MISPVPVEKSFHEWNPNDGVPRLSAAIETHPARSAEAHRLRASLAPLDAYLAIDPDPDGPRLAMRSARLAFDAAGQEYAHHLVIQDDLWIPEGFVEAVWQATTLYPDAIISFFAEWGGPTATLARWATLTQATAVPVVGGYLPTPAVALPSELSLELAHYLRTEAETNSPDDEAILRFARRTGTPTLLLVPNLVEHIDTPSLVGNDWQGVRRSVCVLPEPSVSHDVQVLAAPRMVPFVQWNGGVSMMVYTDPHRGGWRPTLDVLTEWGISVAGRVDACRAVFASRPGFAVIRGRIEDGQLFALWLTAVAMGATMAAHWPAAVAALESRLATPAAAQALRTMAPGALRRLVDTEFLSTYAEDFDALVVGGIKYGAAECQPDLIEA